MERINHESFDEKVLQNKKLTLIDFYSDSCVSCKRMVPVLAELEEAYKEKLFVGKVNVTYERELTEHYGVRSVPDFLFFKDGKLLKQITGVVKKAELEDIILQSI